MDKMERISSYVRQGYDIFKTYGKDKQALENICLGFYQVLKDIDMNHIDYAFNTWLQEQSTMPTPSDIYTICKKRIAEKTKYNNFGNNNQIEYKPRDFKTSIQVKWFDMSVEKFDEQKENLLPELVKHKNNLINLHGVDWSKSYFNQYMRDYVGYNISFEELQKTV